MTNALDTYLEFVESSEAPKQFHRWSFISALSAALGKNVWLQHGGNRIYPNMYVVIVGSAGSRKSSAIKGARKILESSGYGSFAYDKTTREKFLMDFQDGFNSSNAGNGMSSTLMTRVLDREYDKDAANPAYICADELIDFMGPNNVNFLTLLTAIWDKEGRYEDRLKNSQSISINNPIVNMCGGVTPTTFSQVVPREAQSTGLMSRLIIVYSRPSDVKIAWPEAPNERMQKDMVKFFAEAQTRTGEFGLSLEAKNLLEKIYLKHPVPSDMRLHSYASRRFTHLLKLCMVCAVCQGKAKIDKDVVIQANTLLTYAEKHMHRALGEFGDNRTAMSVSRVVEAMSERGGVMTVHDMLQNMTEEIKSMRDLQTILQLGVAARKIEPVLKSNPQAYRVVDDFSERKFIGVDFNKYVPEFGLNQDEDDDDEILFT